MAKASESVFVQRYLTPVAVLLAAVIIALALIFGTGAHKGANTGTQGQTAVDVKDVKTDGEPTVGDKNAPTTVVVFYDYQCPFCKQFELNVTPQLMDYVSSGKTKIVFKDFQFLGEDSKTAALFGRALNDLYPDQFGAWISAMMNAQDDEGDQGFGDLPSIQTLVKAKLPQVDVQKVTDRMNEKKDDYQKAIDADYQEGVSFGVNGTPTIIVGKQLLSGMSSTQFYSTIKTELDSELSS